MSSISLFIIIGTAEAARNIVDVMRSVRSSRKTCFVQSNMAKQYRIERDSETNPPKITTTKQDVKKMLTHSSEGVSILKIILELYFSVATKASKI